MIEAPEKTISKEDELARKLAILNVRGADLAFNFITDVVKGKKPGGTKYDFDEHLVTAINSRVLWYADEMKGLLRFPEDCSTEVNTNLAVSGWEARNRFPLYGRWLSESVSSLKDNIDDLLGALRVASEAHYGLVSADLHPFMGGNGRTARVLVNGILMIGTKELLEYGKAIPPVPIMRSHKTEKGRIDPYVVALSEVDKQRRLNPLELFIAKRWIGTLEARADKIHEGVKRPVRLEDTELIRKFEWRRSLLQMFVSREEQGLNDGHLIPEYFAPRHIIK